MTTTNFVNGTTLTEAAWFNDVDALLYDVFGGAATVAAARTALLGAQKVGTFTRDATTASGTQSVTGVGWAPTLLLLHANINGASASSLGFVNAGASISIFDDNPNGAGTYAVSGTNGIYISGPAPAAVQFALATFDADGFTFNVTKVGAPAGTITVHYVAFRI